MSRSIEELRELLNQHYQDCFESAERLFSDLDPEEITKMCILRLKDYEKAKAEQSDPEEMSDAEALERLVDSEESQAMFEAAAKNVLDTVQGRIPASIN